MKYAILVCNQRDRFQCAECNKLTSAGYQLVDDNETKFVCSECYSDFMRQYPQQGNSVKQLIPAEVLFADGDVVRNTVDESVESVAEESSGYIGELVSDGHGGWREPTAEELAAMNASANAVDYGASCITEDTHAVNIRYRFTTDNKLQIMLPKRCRIDDRTYEIVVTTTD